jgi:hypothetical protein
MALTNNFIPNTSLVFTPMDYSKQLAQRQADSRNAVQGAAKFLGNVIDWSKNNQIAEEMNKENPDYKKIDSIAATKLMNPDTSFSNWRWKQGQDQAAEEARKTREQALALREADLERVKVEKEAAKEERKQAFINKLNATLPTMTVGLTTTPEQAQMYKNTLADLETEMANYGIADDRVATLKNSLYGDLPYNAMMSAIDELNDIDANYGKGSDYNKMNESQKFKVYEAKLEAARQKLIDENPALWEMIQRDSTYRNKFNNLLSNRRPNSKGKEPVRAEK